MNPHRPQTWQRLSDHPTLCGSTFDPEWYDGDAAADLERLRNLALVVLQEFPECSVELHVLDDLTMYVAMNCPKHGVVEIATSSDKSGRDCYYVELPIDPGEHYAPDVASAVSLIGAALGVPTPSA